ncbi:hypothetical protein D3C73_949980 [compost metagenome]
MRMLINGNRRIGPPEEGLRLGRPVIQPGVNLQIRLAGIEPEGGGDLGAVHPVDFTDPDNRASVLCCVIAVLHHTEGVRTVMLRPVEFNPPGNPWPGKPHQRRLNHPVIIDKIIPVGLIQRPVDSPAELRQNFNPDVLIFQNEQLIVLIVLHVRDGLDHRIRIHPARASLVHPLLQKHRIGICCSSLIRRNKHLCFPYRRSLRCCLPRPRTLIRGV